MTAMQRFAPLFDTSGLGTSQQVRAVPRAINQTFGLHEKHGVRPVGGFAVLMPIGLATAHLLQMPGHGLGCVAEPGRTHRGFFGIQMPQHPQVPGERGQKICVLGEEARQSVLLTLLVPLPILQGSGDRHHQQRAAVQVLH